MPAGPYRCQPHHSKRLLWTCPWPCGFSGYEQQKLFLPGTLSCACAGGHGIAWDGSYSEQLQHIVENMYANGKPIAAVDHGPCALVHARNRQAGHPDQGKSILYDRQARGSTHVVLLPGFSFFEHAACLCVCTSRQPASSSACNRVDLWYPGSVNRA